MPVGRPTPPPDQSFDVFTPIRRPDQDGPGYPHEAGYQQSYPDFGNPTALILSTVTAFKRNKAQTH